MDDVTYWLISQIWVNAQYLKENVEKKERKGRTLEYKRNLINIHNH